MKPGLQRESLVEEISRRAWQEKRELHRMGTRRQKTHMSRRPGPRLTSGSTQREGRPADRSEKWRPFSRGPSGPKWLRVALTASSPANRCPVT